MNVSARKTLVDTGPLVALLGRGDQYHRWAAEEFGRLSPPVFTCEAVLSEAQLLVHARGGNPLAVLEMVQRGMLLLAFDLEDHVEPLLQLQRHYAKVPMSLADACLVRMAEMADRSQVMTTDSDFRIYRRNRRQIIPLLAPQGI